MLNDMSIRPLGDRQAADLLQKPDAASLLSTLLSEEVARLRAQRTAALRDRVGSWSDADTVRTSDLVALMGPHYPRYRPYLVRALVGADSSPAFNVSLCRNGLVVDSTSVGTSARRSALVVFLQAAPARAFPSWYRPNV